MTDFIICGEVRYLAPSQCQKCGVIHWASYRTDVSRVMDHNLKGYLNRDFRRRMLDIPEGWEMRGHHNPICNKCRHSKE